MTTKVKIIIGFSAMMILLAVIAGLGYRSASNSAMGFAEYQRLARLNIASSDMATELYTATADAQAFLKFRDPKDMETAQAGLDAAMKQVEAARSYVIREDLRALIDNLEGHINAFHTIFNNLEASAEEANTLFMEGVVVTSATLQQEFVTFAGRSAEVGDTEGLLANITAQNALAGARAAVTRYSENWSQVDETNTRNGIAGISTAVEVIRGNLVSERGKQMMAVLDGRIQTYSASFEALVVGVNTILAHLDAMNQELEQTLSQVRELSAACDTQMRAFGTQMRTDSDAVATQMMIIAVAGLLVGLAVTLYIVLSLSRILKELAEFATAVAAGNFASEIRIKEGGEIGAMVKAVRSIPEVITHVMDDARELSRQILAGRFRTRLDSGSYSGSFVALSDTFNTVSSAYTDVLDLMPVAIQTCNPSKSISFLNKAAQDMVGGNHVNQPCADHMKSGACRTEHCFGDNCMKRHGSQRGETSMTPLGAKVDVNMTAIPLQDENGKQVGFIELINDISEIKDKQNTILRVASDASSIADRVAAASEEIAAQVEQISRGAEIQRERVMSTAGAMAEMNSTVMEVARNAGQASEQSGMTSTKAHDGAELVRQVVTAIGTVNTVAQSLQTDMSSLGEQAESIGSVMNVITDIADQTNLLALNAAIEAARAGEAGRGFAVVADSVRQLAEKTMHATQEVGNSITTMQTSTRKSMSAMENAVRSVAEATSLAASSGDALNEIVRLAADNSNVVTSIATAAEQQSATSEEINRALEEINTVVHETTEGMVQSSSAVHELSSMTQELRKIIDSLR